jgi:hypothetical protein
MVDMVIGGRRIDVSEDVFGGLWDIDAKFGPGWRPDLDAIIE